MHSNPFIRRDKRVAAVMKIKSIQGKLRVIGCSKKTMELVQRCYHLKDSQMGYIYNPISVSDFMQAPFNNTKCNFVALGRDVYKRQVECLDAVLELGGFDEIHIGLNDLHLSYKLDFMFELLANGTVEKLCRKIKEYGFPYGFGGIACLDGGLLPATNVIMEHYRLGSTRVILSRSFCDTNFNLNYEELFRCV